MVSGKSTKKTRSPAPVVSRRQGLPWLTIGAVLVVVALAAGIFYVVFSKTQEKNAVADALAPWTPSVENPDPSVNIPGIYIGANTPATADGPASYVDYKAAIPINADQRVAYNRYPPVGGPHDGTWANCMGIVYDSAVRSENMVHTLEHGAVWITYNPDTISAADLATLKSLVQGQPFTTLTPYPGLDSTISLQAWAHQLKVDSASDERVKQFVTALRQNRRNPWQTMTSRSNSPGDSATTGSTSHFVLPLTWHWTSVTGPPRARGWTRQCPWPSPWTRAGE